MILKGRNTGHSLIKWLIETQGEKISENTQNGITTTVYKLRDGTQINFVSPAKR